MLRMFATTAVWTALIVTSAAAAPLPKPAAFFVCSACHVTASGQAPTIGPNLFGVSQRKSGEAPGYSYSPSMTKAAISWTPEHLAAFITAPQKVVPGTKMGYAGQKDPDKVKEIVDYLASLK